MSYGIQSVSRKLDQGDSTHPSSQTQETVWMVLAWRQVCLEQRQQSHRCFWVTKFLRFQKQELKLFHLYNRNLHVTLTWQVDLSALTGAGQRWLSLGGQLPPTTEQVALIKVPECSTHPADEPKRSFVQKPGYVPHNQSVNITHRNPQ